MNSDFMIMPFSNHLLNPILGRVGLATYRQLSKLFGAKYILFFLSSGAKDYVRKTIELL